MLMDGTLWSATTRPASMQGSKSVAPMLKLCHLRLNVTVDRKCFHLDTTLHLYFIVVHFPFHIILHSSLQCPYFCIFCLFFFSGSSRWVPVRVLRWATICGWHASCCIVCVKILGLLHHWTPNQ